MEEVWPGATSACVADADTQPHDTRTPAMWTGWPVVLVKRNEWVSVGPRGTEPKSRDNSSNMPSAHEPAEAAPTTPKANHTATVYRNIEPRTTCLPRPRALQLPGIDGQFRNHY